MFKLLPHIKISGITIYFGMKDWVKVGDYICFPSLYDLNTEVNRRLESKIIACQKHHD